jgi:hypothetical protein
MIAVVSQGDDAGTSIHDVARDPVSDADLSLPTVDRLGTVRGRKKRSGLVCFDDESASLYPRHSSPLATHTHAAAWASL